MQILIDTPEGSTRVLQVDSSCSVESLKLAYQGLEGMICVE